MPFSRDRHFSETRDSRLPKIDRIEIPNLGYAVIDACSIIHGAMGFSCSTMVTALVLDDRHLLTPCANGQLRDQISRCLSAQCAYEDAEFSRIVSTVRARTRRVPRPRTLGIDASLVNGRKNDLEVIASSVYGPGNPPIITCDWKDLIPNAGEIEIATDGIKIYPPQKWVETFAPALLSLVNDIWS